MTLLRDHVDRFGTGLGGRIFTGPRGGIVAEWAYLEVFHTARREALTETEARTPLMGRPYDLRHAAVSTWLNAWRARCPVHVFGMVKLPASRP